MLYGSECWALRQKQTPVRSMHWTNAAQVWACVQSWSAANNWTAASHLDYSEKAPDAVQPLGKDGWVSWCQQNSYSGSLEWLEKAGRTSSHLLSLHILSVEDATELALDRPLWRLFAASGAMHWMVQANNDDDDDYNTYYSVNRPMNSGFTLFTSPIQCNCLTLGNCRSPKIWNWLFSATRLQH